MPGDNESQCFQSSWLARHSVRKIQATNIASVLPASHRWNQEMRTGATMGGKNVDRKTDREIPPNA
jgi:hypothetical protein